MTKYKVEVFNNGTQYWHLAGTDVYHRVGGPAIIHPDGYKAWYQHGKYHNEDGPAVEHASGEKEYWLYGKKYKGIKSYRVELETIRRAEARLKRELDQVNRLNAMAMHPPILAHPTFGAGCFHDGVPFSCFGPISDDGQTVTFKRHLPTHWTLELTVAEIEEKLGYKIKVIK